MTNSKTSNYDASASALGYLHQCRCALLLALENRDEPGMAVSIEKFDDVALHDGGNQTAVELRQHKLHLSRQGNLGNMSPDIWKTIRAWADAVVEKKIELTKVRLCLVTTSLANHDSAIILLRPPTNKKPDDRKPEVARRRLEEAGSKSDSESVRKGYDSLQRLNTKHRQQFFASIHLLDNSIQVTDYEHEVRRQVWAAVEREHLPSFVERLEGWWINQVVNHLLNDKCEAIPCELVRRIVDHIRSEYRQGRLPDNLLTATIPDSAIPRVDERKFVRQLELIQAPELFVRRAQEAFYRAFAQRSRWVTDKLCVAEEFVDYEARLVESWKDQFLFAHPQNENTGVSDASNGWKLYNWAVNVAPYLDALRIRIEFTSPYMTIGSFHLLANKLTVGWHRSFAELLADSTPPTVNKPSETGIKSKTTKSTKKAGDGNVRTSGKK